jgi:hypothetical protein
MAVLTLAKRSGPGDSGIKRQLTWPHGVEGSRSLPQRGISGKCRIGERARLFAETSFAGEDVHLPRDPMGDFVGSGLGLTPVHPTMHLGSICHESLGNHKANPFAAPRH